MRTAPLLLLLLFVPAGAAAAQDSPRPALVLGPKGEVWGAWSERQGERLFGRVAQRRGGAWQALGAGLNSGPDLSVAAVALALAPDGTLWTAWGEKPLRLSGKSEGSGLLRVAFWTGGAWAEPAPSPSQSARTVAERPQLRLDAQGRPWVTWSEITPDFNVDNVYVAVLDRGAWTLVDNGSLTTDVSSSSRSRDLRLDPAGRPVLAFSRLVYQQDFQVFAGPWEGQAWRPWGGALNLDLQAWAGFPSLAFGPDGRPAVAFLQAGDGFRLVVKHWTGSAWQAWGRPSDPGLRSPRLGFDGRGRPLVAAIEGASGLTLRAWDGAEWPRLGAPVSAAGAFVDSFDLALDAAGQPWLFWAEDAASGPLLGLARWDGRAWRSE